jgi:hypothetical protein
MLNQVHIGYVGWNDPPRQTAPKLERVPGVAGKVAFTSSMRADARTVTREAATFDRASNAAGLVWTRVGALGRGDAVLALPQGKGPTSTAEGVRLEYDVTLERSDSPRVKLDLAPTLDATGGAGVRVGVSIDQGPVSILTAGLRPTAGAARSPEQDAWVAAVKDNLETVEAGLGPVAAGRHTVKVWRIDDNVVLEKLTVSTP